MTDKPPQPAETQQQIDAGFNPVAGGLAWVFPGLGHIYRGELKRGLYAAIGVMGLLLTGLLVGGVDTIDSKEDKWWFFGQVIAGPTVLAIDTYHQRALKAEGPARSQYAELIGARRAAYPDERKDPSSGRWIIDPENPAPPHTKSVGLVNDLGTLFGLIAGMLNLIAILDALLPRTKPAA